MELPAPKRGRPLGARGGTRKREYTLLQLRSRHRKVIRLAATGIYKVKEIAAIVGLTPEATGGILSTEQAQVQLQQLNAAADLGAIDVAKGFRENSVLAQEFLTETLLNEDADTKDRLKAAKEILDRGGYPASKIVEHAPRVGDKEIREIKEKAKENALKMGLISEAVVKDGSKGD